MHRFLATDTHPTTIYVRTDPNETVGVRDVLARTANPAHPEDVAVSRPSDALAAEIATKGSYNTLLLGLGTIALIVGAVGIANVMVMSIIQRRALGATRRQIAIQFAAEALILSALGAAAGVLAGILMTAAYAHARHWSTTIPPALFPAALVAALAFGLVASLYPAIKAASVAPNRRLPRHRVSIGKSRTGNCQVLIGRPCRDD